MSQEDKLPKRLRRLAGIRSSNTRYFLTLCTRNRERSLSSDSVHNAFVEFMRGSPERYGWFCGEYVLLPDHAHFFAAPSQDAATLGTWIKAIKAFVRRASKAQDIFWQKGFFDHILRSSESYSQKWDYVRQNPIRAGLTEKAEDWPFLGQIDRLTM